MIKPAAIAKLQIVAYPDPVLRASCAPIDTFDETLDAVVDRMFELMHAARGVGLAGPQVGLPWRLFVWNSTGQPEDDAVCINPTLSHLVGQEEAEEGCLSIDGVNVHVKRALVCHLTAQTLTGATVESRGEGLIARIWQHENDHLDGRLILDYMSSADEIANRRAIKELTSKYQAAHPKPKSRTARRKGVRFPPDLTDCDVPPATTVSRRLGWTRS